MPGLAPVALIGRPKTLFGKIDDIELPKSLAQQIDETPTQGVGIDALKRTGRSLVDQPGAIVESGGTMLDLMERALRAYGAGQGQVDNAFLPEHLRTKAENPAEAMERELRRPSANARVVQDTGRQMRKDAGELYTGDFAPDTARDRSLVGMTADSSGSMAAALITPGGVVSKTLTATLLNSQGAADDAEKQLLAQGKSEEEARNEAARQFVLNLPAGAIESVGWGKLLGRYGKGLEEAVSEKWGKNALQRILKTAGQQAAIEGGEEVLQQGAENLAAKETYDPDRKLSEGMKEAGMVGALMGGGTAGGVQLGAEVADKLDTGRNKPERPEDLKAQQQQLVDGNRVVQMFPLGTDELALPKGMARVETPRGVFHFDPRRMTADEILGASKAGRENELLGLGPHSKADVEQRARAGEPVAAVVERGPNGEELRGAAATPSTLEATAKAMESGKSKDSTVNLERMADVLRGRETGGLDEMIDQAAEEQQRRAKQLETETSDREQRQAAAREKREKFAFHLGNAQRVAEGVSANAKPAVAEVVGPANVLRDYLQDNTLGLSLEQKQQARELLGKLQPIEERIKAEAEEQTQARLTEEKAQREHEDLQRRDRIRTENRAVAKSDLDPVTGKKRIDTMTDDELVQAAQGGNTAAMRLLEQRSTGPTADAGEDLLSVLKKVKLPGEDATMGSELTDLKKEWVNFGDRQQLFTGKPGSLDQVAEVLRSSHGFSGIQTPADVIEFTKRALRGERIMPDRLGGKEQVDFARENDDIKDDDSASNTPDPFTGVPSDIGGSRVTAAQALRIAERARETQVRALKAKPGTESGVASPQLRRLDVSLAGDELINHRTGRKLPLLGAGAEADAFRDPESGAVYKVFKPGEQGSLGQRLVFDDDGSVMFDTGTQRDLLEKIRVINELGGTPTEVQGITQDGELLVKQPYGTPRAWEDGDTANQTARLLEIPNEVINRPKYSAPVYLSKIADAYYLISDLNHNNYIRDTLNRSRINDLATHQITAHELNRSPQLRDWIAAQADKSTAPGPAEFARLEVDDGTTHAGPKLAEIEAKMLRGGVERDTAARAVNRYIDATEGKPNWDWFNGKQVTVNEDEAHSLNRAVKAYDAGEKFNWPDEDLRKRVMLHFAKDEQAQQPGDKTGTPLDVADFEARLQRIAPGLMMRYKVLVGEPELLLQMGVRQEQLTGREQAAHFPRRKALWFLARNVRAGKDGLMEDRLRRDVLHETTHAWLDSVDDDTEEELRGRWKNDIGNPTGWLATMRKDQVKLRKGVETDWKEYWAERIAQENSRWGARREGALAGERGFVSQLAYEFRQWLQEAIEYLQAAFTRTKRYNVDFRAFLDDSRFPSPEPAAAGPASAAPAPLAAAQGEAASFATEETPAERQAALVRQLNNLTRTINEAEKAGTLGRRRGLLGMRSEIRTQLDDDFPNWRKEHPEGPDGLRRKKPEQTENPEPETDAVPPPEREFAARPGIYSEVEGHTTVRVPWHERTWEKIKTTLRGIRGSIPELPAFADDKEQKYNRLRLFNKLNKRGTPRVWKEAADQLGTIVKPLLDAGKLDANAYARLGRLQERARQMREENRQMPEAMREEIADLNRDVEREPYGLFQKIAFYLDLKWRVENLKDDQGNAIAQPGGLNVKEINDRLGQLKEQLNTSPHRAAILDALKQHQAMVKEIAADLRARDLTMPEEMQNPFYFPHIVLGKGRDTLDRVKLDTAEDFRAYLLKPVGSTKPIETDYTKAMYYHLVAVGSHNLRSDLVKDYVKPYDIMAEVKDRAKELGREYGRGVSWREAFATEFAHDGYVTFHPDDKLPLHPEMTVDRDTLARRLGVVLTEEPLQEQLEALGLKGIKLLPEDIKEALAAGEQETWILPEKVAEAMHGMLRRETRTEDSMISKPIQALQAGWKKNILFAPWNYPRYEFNNTVADLEKLLSADPEVYRLLPTAAKEVREFIEGGKGSRDLHEAFKRGVLDSVTAAEVNDLTVLKQFEKLQTSRDKITSQALRRLSTLFLAGNRSTLDVSKLREATFRYAKYKADLDRLRHGARPIYAGAYWRDIDAIEDSRKGAGDANYQKAAEISLATFGDYHNISVFGQQLRKYLIPFYSWMEINFKYHANLLRNLKDMTAASELSAADAAKAGARAVAVGASTFTRKAAGGVLLRLALPYLAAMLWNNSGDRDELEDGLSAEDKRRFHIILGKDGSGKTMVVYGQTAFADVAKWFGGMDAMRLVEDIAGGKTNFKTAFSDWLQKFPRDLANNLFQVGPAVKIAYTAMSGKSSFPDVTDQRTIPANDLKWTILGQATDQFTADMIRRTADKDYLAPRDMKDWAQQSILQVRKRDPQQWAFYEMKDKAAQFLEAKTGQTRDSSYNAPDQQVLRNFRRAIYKGDVENAMRFYDRLLELGYTAERFKASIRAQDPLSALPKDLRDDFVKSLSRFERAQLQHAYEYYLRMAENRGAEKSLFPSQKLSERLRLQYRPRHDRLREEMQNTERLSDEDQATRAEKELRRSVRPSMR